MKEPGMQKIDPKLRMIANGSLVVNTLRAERAGNLVIRDQRALDETPLMRGSEDTSFTFSAADPFEGERGHLDKPPEGVFVNVFVQLSEGVEHIPAVIAASAVDTPVRRQNLVSASVPLDRLEEIATDPQVVTVEQSERIVFSPPVETGHGDEVPDAGWQRSPSLAGGNGGQGVLVGIIDVQGFDFAHPDFLTPEGKTRFIRIWDQGGAVHPAPPAFGYGSEFTAEQMNAALEAGRENGLPATQLEPQSQMVPSSHGTHVASIAAGNLGVAPQAAIAAVLISLPREDTDRRKSFYDSSRITHAVDYLFQLGLELGLPVSINISLGTNGHAHDGSSVTSRWLDYALTHPGRCVTLAAGNAGQERAAAPGDLGFVMGRIHTSGQVPAAGVCEIEWVVVGDGRADLSENEMEIWYSAQDHFGIQIMAPDGAWSEVLAPGEFIENRELENKTFLSVYNELYAATNGINYIALYLSPFFSDKGVIGVKSGTWRVRLHGLDVRGGTYHAWIERDDPRRLGRVGMLEGWSFPSFMSELSNVDNSSVSSLACGQNIVSVANLDEPSEKINITSSQGPTRDGRLKPDVAAPGTKILAANGFSPDRPWVRMSGTSMAAPYVTGVVAQMLAANPGLTSAQIGAMLSRTARPLPKQGFKWRDDAGYGRIDPGACLEEVRRAQERKDRTK